MLARLHVIVSSENEEDIKKSNSMFAGSLNAGRRSNGTGSSN